MMGTATARLGTGLKPGDPRRLNLRPSRSLDLGTGFGDASDHGAEVEYTALASAKGALEGGDVVSGGIRACLDAHESAGEVGVTLESDTGQACLGGRRRAGSS